MENTKTLSDRISQASVKLYDVRELLYKLLEELVNDHGSEIVLENGKTIKGFEIEFTTEDGINVVAVDAYNYYTYNDNDINISEMNPLDVDYILGELSPE